MEEKTPRKISECEDAGLLERIEKKKYYAAKHWYALFVQPGHENQVFDYLMGIEKDMEVKKKRRGKAKREDLFIKIDEEKVRMQCFLAQVPHRVKYTDRYIWRYKMITPGIIFVNCVLDDRDLLFHSPITEYVTGFLNDRTRHWPLRIPDVQMELFQSLVENEVVLSVGKPDYKPGQKVLVTKGVLQNRVVTLAKVEERVSKTEVEVDRLGHPILDADGNPIPKHKVVLIVHLNADLVANIEIDARDVVPAPEGAKEYDGYE